MMLIDRLVIHADCIEAMREMADCSVDAIVTDPPYGLEFMGKEWDGPKAWAVGFSETGYAAALEGFRFVGIEREVEYVAIARARIEHWAEQAVQSRSTTASKP